MSHVTSHLPGANVSTIVRSALLPCAIFGVMAVFASNVASGQTERALTVVVGAMQYDLRGTGTTAVSGVRFDVPANRFLIIEPALTYARYNAGTATARAGLLIPEVQLQLQARIARVRPFIGFGGGVAFESGLEPGGADAVVSGAIGSRFDLADSWGARAELRLRSVDPWIGSTADWTLGLSRRF